MPLPQALFQGRLDGVGFLCNGLDFRVSTESWHPQVSGFLCIGLMVGPQGHCAGSLN